MIIKQEVFQHTGTSTDLMFTDAFTVDLFGKCLGSFFNFLEEHPGLILTTSEHIIIQQ